MFLEVQSSVEGNSQVFQLFLNLYSVISHTRYVGYTTLMLDFLFSEGRETRTLPFYAVLFLLNPNLSVA